MAHLWIVYDERAMNGDTDDAAVLESCNSEREAMRCDFEGVVFRYDIVEAKPRNQLVNETLIGPTRRLAKRSA